MLKRSWWFAFPFVGLLVIVALVYILPTNSVTGDEPVPIDAVRVLKAYPHDVNSFSQGLVIDGMTLFEGTGRYGTSKLREIELETGVIQREVPLGDRYFGEGITLFGDRIYQLTWKEQICVVYDRQKLQPLGSLRYTGEGWGLTDDEKYLYMSDGSSTIRVLDPQTFRLIRRIPVREGRRRVERLNELEFINGEIWANIWYLDRIARINPKDGQILGWIDCSQVYPAAQRPDREHAMNGIAYDEASERIFITGKNWPRVYEIEVVKKSGN